MRTATTILFLFILHKLQATTYYVSNAGNDANDGLTPETSWQTLAKVNNTATEGDTVKFKCNDTWYVTNRLIPASNNIYYTSYSTGAKPLITGFVSATVGSPTANVYTINVPDAVADLKTVLINGKLAIKARYPNSTYLTYSASTTTSLTTSLTGTPDYTGKEIVVRSSRWVLDVTKVASQSTGTLTLSPATTYDGDAFGANGFFFQNHADFLDSLNEFSYDSVNKVLKVYATSTPTVQYSTADTLVWMRSKTGITVDGIAFTGANKTVFQLDTCSYITIQNCTLNNNGTNGITAYKTHHSTFDSDSIMNCWNAGIYARRFDPYTPMQDTCNKLSVTNNYIKNIAAAAGMGLSENERYMGIIAMGDSLNVSNNRLDSIGYIPIKYNGRWSSIKNNYITNYANVKDDAGGIYTVIGVYVWAYFDTASVIRGNIIHGGIGASVGTSGNINYPTIAAGIYLDDNPYQITVDSNTIFNTIYACLNTRTARFLTIKDNLFVDSLGSVLASSGNGVQQHSFNLKRNIYYQKNSSTQIFTDTRWADNGTDSDSNYYLRPLAPTNLIKWYEGNMNYSYPHLFTDSTGFDLNGGTTPTGLLHNYSTLIYNPTYSDSTTSLPDTYIDVYGNIYVNNQSINLAPFASKLLFRYQYNYTKSQNYFIPH